MDVRPYIIVSVGLLIAFGIGLYGIFRVLDVPSITLDVFAPEPSPDTIPPPDSTPAPEVPSPLPPPVESPPARAPGTLPFHYTFNNDGVLAETRTPERSRSPYWWLSSGGRFEVDNGVGKTLIGTLSSGDPLQRAYASANGRDTDGGLRPQNIFRLVTLHAWENISSEAYFTLLTYNESASPSRAGHNGVFLFSRYKDSDNLYYAGLRVDGNVVIKKKINGRYYTLALEPLLEGRYHRTSNPNLIPVGTPIGLRMITETESSDAVRLRLLTDLNNLGRWTEVFDIIDDGSIHEPITGAGRAGIRTDFMDVTFDEFLVRTP